MKRLVLRLRMIGVMLIISHIPSWHAQTLYLCFFVRFRLRFWTVAAVCSLLDFRLFSATLPISGCGSSLTNVPRITCDVNSLFVPSAYRKALLLLTRHMTNRVCNVLCKMTKGKHEENDTLLLKESF